MGIFELILLSVGLAMDAFAVSICKGLAVGKVRARESLICGIWFGVFQALMPLVGYLVGSRFEKWISIVAPWAAFIILSIIGCNMIREAFSEEEETGAEFHAKAMFPLAIATSIDALAVGITLVAVPVQVLDAGALENTLFGVGMIGVITFLISAVGVRIGSIFGTRYKAGSEVMGGTILIFIGLHALLESLDTAGAMSNSDTIFGMLIPLVGTVLGAAYVYTDRRDMTGNWRSVCAGCSAGIMFSISVWGMIEPAARGFSASGKNPALPLFFSFCGGVLLHHLLDLVVPHTHAFVEITEGPHSSLRTEIKMMLAEVIHHVPEGIALGAIYAAHFMETDWTAAPMAAVLAIAIAIQNFPEAVFVSLPIREKGTGMGKAFFMGVISGVPVPLMGVITLLVVLLFPAVLPYCMAMAGGAMIVTIVEELPQMSVDRENDKGAISFVFFFALVMLMIYMG